jgi:hypothetical protein
MSRLLTSTVALLAALSVFAVSQAVVAQQKTTVSLLCSTSSYLRVVPRDFSEAITRRELEQEVKEGKYPHRQNTAQSVVLDDSQVIHLTVDERDVLETNLHWLDSVPDDRLTSLTLMFVRISKEGPARLKKKSIRHLAVYCNDIDVTVLLDAIPLDAERIEVYPVSQGASQRGKAFTDDAVVSICQLRKLKCFRTEGTKISDASFEALAEVPKLEAVEIMGLNETTDAGPRALSKSSSLREVSLQFTAGMTDEGILELLSLPHLEHLILVGGSRLKKATFRPFVLKLRQYGLNSNES